MSLSTTLTMINFRKLSGYQGTMKDRVKARGNRSVSKSCPVIKYIFGKIYKLLGKTLLICCFHYKLFSKWNEPYLLGHFLDINHQNEFLSYILSIDLKMFFARGCVEYLDSSDNIPQKSRCMKSKSVLQLVSE